MVKLLLDSRFLRLKGPGAVGTVIGASAMMRVTSASAFDFAVSVRATRVLAAVGRMFATEDQVGVGPALSGCAQR